MNKKKALVIGAALLLVVALGGTGYFLFWPEPATASSTVEDYFDYLSENKVDQALELVYADGSDSWDDYPLLTSEALSDEGSRPTDVVVESARTVESSGDLSVYEVEVAYEISGARVNQGLYVVKDAAAEVEFQIDAPFVSIDIEDMGFRSISVNGIDVDVDDMSDIVAFPGTYVATAAGDVLLAEATQGAEITTSAMTDMPVAEIYFPEATLADGAKELVIDKVTETIDSCLESTESRPDGCPFGFYSSYDDISVEWTLVSYPEVNVGVVDSSSYYSDGPVEIMTSEYGTVEYTATYTNYSGETKTTEGDDSFGIDGYASLSGEEIVVEFW